MTQISDVLDRVFFQCHDGVSKAEALSLEALVIKALGKDNLCQVMIKQKLTLTLTFQFAQPRLGVLDTWEEGQQQKLAVVILWEVGCNFQYLH